jgi:hypothetical protein
VRWLTLYARSRQVPASIAATLVGAAAIWGLARMTEGAGPVGAGTAALVPTWAVAASAIGLSGQDPALDRTAAIRWAPRRASHVLLIGLFAGGVLAGLQATAGDPARAGFVIRDIAGLTGLAAIAATLFSGQFGWTLPFAWFTIALFVPPATDVTVQVATWMLQPPGTPAATWTALLLATTGTVAYTLRGPRR